MKPQGLLLVIPNVLLCLVQYCSSEKVLQHLEDSVGAGNYTYYRLSRAGRIRVTLDSLYGDADLYISDVEARPTYDNFEQQSVTCGIDEVIVPSAYSRPVNIGVYGHPRCEISKYRITIIFIAESDDETYSQLLNTYYNYDESEIHDGYPGTSNRMDYPSPSAANQDTLLDEDEEGSTLWQIFLFIMKIIFEVILN